MRQPTVALVAQMGDDLTIVNAARASMAKSSEKLTTPDLNLLRFMANPTRPGEPEEEPHTSPFRHGILRFAVESDLQTRLAWEGVDNQFGMVFQPTLRAVSSWAQQPGVFYQWNWAVSVAAACRWMDEAKSTFLRGMGITSMVFDGINRAFPASLRALSGQSLTLSDIHESTYRKPIDLPDPIDCLGKQGHIQLVDYLDGPTNHESVLQFQIHAPLMIRSQWFKYRTRGDHSPQGWMRLPWMADGEGNGDDGSEDRLYARNEQSRRADTGRPQIYNPVEWRSAPGKGKKQGSGDALSADLQEILRNEFAAEIDSGMLSYENALRIAGVAPQQARLFLPGAYGLMTSWYWTTSLEGFNHFRRERLHPAAQDEIREYAVAADKLAEAVLPRWGR